MANRLNKRQRQARAKRRIAAQNELRERVAKAEAIPCSRSNVSSWSRVPKFGGVGYTSGHDTGSNGKHDLNTIASKRTDYCDPSLVAYNRLSSDMKLAIDKVKASRVS